MIPRLFHADCIEAMRELPDDSVDSIVTDPPYGLGFMGKHWDDLPPGKEWAAECLRVLKPGGHLLAFGGTRTWHRLVCAIEDAGFEIRDSIAWLYGSGFPKSLDVSKAIDKAAGAEREEREDPRWAERYPNGNGGNHNRGPNGIYGEAESILGRRLTTSDPATPEAAQWQGFGTALKPAFEPICVARKPIGGVIRSICGRCQGEDEDFRRDCEKCGGLGYVTRSVGTVAANVLRHGTGALNIDGCRIGTELITAHGGGNTGAHRTYNGDKKNGQGIPAIPAGSNPRNGRWPANVVLDETQAAQLDQQSGNRPGFSSQTDITTATPGEGWGRIGHLEPGQREGYNDSGGASRFFYNVKPDEEPQPPKGRWPANVVLDETQAAQLDQQSGVTTSTGGNGSGFRSGVFQASDKAIVRDGPNGLGKGDTGGASRFFFRAETDPPFLYCAKAPKKERPTVDGISHPTVKPLSLMRWLVRLVTPPGGTVLDPFAGSGATGEAAMMEGFDSILIEREKDYFPLILARILRQPRDRV